MLVDMNKAISREILKHLNRYATFDQPEAYIEDIYYT